MATQATGQQVITGFIVRRWKNEFLSRKGEWIEQPQGIVCAFVHQLEEILNIDRTIINQAQYMYFGEYSPETGFAKSRSLPLAVPKEFRNFQDDLAEAVLEQMTVNLKATQTP